MNTIPTVPTVPFLKSQVQDQAVAEEAQYRAPLNGPRGGRPLSPGQIARKLRRVRRADSIAMGKKSRRNAFKQRQDQERTHQTLVGWGRVYFDGAGNEAMRRNVTDAVHRQAELYSKSAGEPFNRALELVEQAMRDAAVRDAARRWAKAA